MTLTSPAYAKINLSLRILRKREDGFHELTTRMAPIALADSLTVKLHGTTGQVEFTCSDASIPADGSNLVVQAVRALAEIAGPLPGLALHLEKRIPHGAGLGGGSSDAAVALRLVVEIANLTVSEQQLVDVAAKLGSDVPFFLTHAIADCAGRGEAVKPLFEMKLGWRILLIKLPFGVPTPWAYSRWQPSRELPDIDYSAQHVDGIELVNDLERPVFEKYVVLALLKQQLRHQPGVRAALMSGSGSTVFAVLEPTADLPSLTKFIHDLVGTEVWLHDTRLAC
jgi:4-diphosphocytidyl-2-C-methyl-D-erythritol kinase